MYWLALKCFDTTLTLKTLKKKKKIPKLFCNILSKYSKHLNDQSDTSESINASIL